MSKQRPTTADIIAQRTSKSRHFDNWFTSRQTCRHNSPLIPSPNVEESSFASLPSHASLNVAPSSSPISSFTISNDELEDRIDHLLQKNYTKTDPLTLSNPKARQFVLNAASAQQQILERARKIDKNTNTDFADM